MKTGPKQPREYRRRPLPADLKDVLQLQEELKKLEDAYAYISAGACRDLIRARRKDLQDLQVLREKDLLAFYCARSGLKAPEKIERIEEILDLYGEVSAEEAESNPGEGGKAFPRKTKTGQNAQEVQIEQNAQGVQAERKKQGPQAEQAGQTAQGQSAEGRLAALLRTHNDRYIDRALAELRARGVAFHPRSDEEILQKILQNEGNRYVRRLFCVAMTRTKNRVYFIAPLQEPSEFLLELLHDYKNVRLDAFVEGAEQKTETDSGLSNLQENSGRLNLQENAGQKTAPAACRAAAGFLARPCASVILVNGI